MERLNTVLPNGTFGMAVSSINTNFSLIVSAINGLEYSSTKSKGIRDYGFIPSTETLPNAANGDWCMVLSEGNTFPATIWTFDGTTWSQGGTWDPEGIDLSSYAKTTEMTDAIAASLAQAIAQIGYAEVTVSGTTLSASLQNYVLPTSGGTIHLKMSAPGTGASTLNINNTGAKELWYNGAAVSDGNTWEANEIISVFYDGTRYMASNSQGGGKADSQLDENSTLPVQNKVVTQAINTISANLQVSAISIGITNTAKYYQYPLGLQAGKKYKFEFDFASALAADVTASLSSSSSSQAGAVLINTAKAGSLSSEFYYTAEDEELQYLYWLSSAANTVSFSLYEVDENESLADTDDTVNSLSEYSHLVGKVDTISIRASRYQWDGMNGTIGTTEAIRAHLRLDAIGLKRITVTMPSQYYAGFFYVDRYNHIKGIVDATWHTGTVTLDLNGKYDVMFNIKYKAAGTTKITLSMVNSAYWDITRYYDDSVVPALPLEWSPYEKDLSHDTIVGNVQTEGNARTDSNIRGYYKMLHAPKGCKITARVNEGYDVIILGEDGAFPAKNLTSGWQTEQTIINYHYDTLWFSFKYGDNVPFTTEILDAMGFTVNVTPAGIGGVMDYNAAKQPKIASLCRKHTIGSGVYKTQKCFVFAHITDTHALNRTVQRAVDFLNEYSDIDMLLHTGDIQRKSFNDATVVTDNNIAEFIAALNSAEKPFLLSLGNHDQNGAGGDAITLNKIYTRFMKPMVDKGWIAEGTNIDANNNATWYYKDFAKYSIRFICLNSFDPLYDGYETSKGMDDNYTKYSQAQITWLINTLQSVPEGYHVIVAMHTPYDSGAGDYPVIVNPDWSSTSKVNAGTHGSTQPSKLNGNPMLDVLAAYKGKTSVTGTYSYNESAVQTRLGSITVDADFSQAEGTLAFLPIGHNHDDWVGEFQSKGNIKCVCMPGSMLTEPDSDLGRGYLDGTSNEWQQRVAQMELKLQGKSQDAINVYIVRTDLRKVYIVRMGADFTTDLRDRVLTSFEY